MSVNIRILFGTETGNSEECAHEMGDALEEAGHSVTVTDMGEFQPSDLAKEALALIITSTYGNGDPPYNAEALLKWLGQPDVSISGVSFAVCGLGDLTYPRFAQAGKDFDRLMEERGGRRILPRQDCDVVYEEPVEQFTLAVQEWLTSHADTLVAPDVQSGQGVEDQDTTSQTMVAKPPGTRGHPVQAILTGRRRLNASGSEKETMHYEFSWPGVEVSFSPGDSFAVVPENNPVEVQTILDGLSLNGSSSVRLNDEDTTLLDALTQVCDLQIVSQELGNGLVANQKTGSNQMETIDFSDMHLIDVVQAFPGTQIDGQVLVDALRTLKPRLYSVASSPLVHPNGVHFTVETLRYSRRGRDCEGVATTWLADRVADGETVAMYCVQAPHFRLPDDNKVPIIMVGPGTGVAPFRAFLQQRRAMGSPGKSWLFFGHQHQSTDFLYETEIDDFLSDGTLTEISLAWSRDQADKVYVQHLIQRQGPAIWSWLVEGAMVYVCGDKNAMAPQV